jgi:hypothetical protein
MHFQDLIRISPPTLYGRYGRKRYSTVTAELASATGKFPKWIKLVPPVPFLNFGRSLICISDGGPPSCRNLAFHGAHLSVYNFERTSLHEEASTLVYISIHSFEFAKH